MRHITLVVVALLAITVRAMPDECTLAVKVGRCKAAFPRFYYDTESVSCKSFTYGGCDGNSNNFLSHEECEKKCVTPIIENEDPCKLPMKAGTCRGYFPRFYFDTQQRKCQKFVYGGCNGNKNNFLTMNGCKKRCEKSVIEAEDICKLPAKIGPCKANFPRFYFDTKLRKCQKFGYGGCRANKNNFLTIEACEGNCSRLFVAEEAGVSTANDPHIPLICLHAVKVGPCKAAMPRYYYKAEVGRCGRFRYGGCNGNSNNFLTFEECERKCIRPTKGEVSDSATNEYINPEFCSLAPEVGPCKASMPRYYYNAEAGGCGTFRYGGCNGNKNNFQTIEECHKSCSKKSLIEAADSASADNAIPDFCLLAAETGRCKAAFQRYFYNAESERCEEFVYGGCRGNRNNFLRKEDCVEKCERRPPKTYKSCFLPMEVGKCRARMKKYYFDFTNKRCRRFYYGGCGGNGNNFESWRECAEHCAAQMQSVQGNVTFSRHLL